MHSWILRLCLSVLGLCSFAAGQNLPSLKVGEHTFHRRELANGLRGVVVRDKGARVSVFMVIGAGTRHETPETTGLAHLTEHAMYAGTAKRGLGKHDRLIHAMRGESNAFTREDYTLFYDHKIPADKLDVVLSMEADRLRGLTFDEKSVLFERERLRREEARTWQPKEARQQLLESRAFRVHNYRAGVLDSKGHTKAPGLPVATVRAFYDRYYRPDNTVVVVVGDVEPDKTLDLIASSFAELKNGEKRPPLPKEPAFDAPREEKITVDLARDRCNFVWLVPEMGHADRPALAVLARLLSRRTAGDKSPIEASLPGRVDQDLFQVAATGENAREELTKVLAKARSETFAAKEVAEVTALLADEFATLPLRARPYFSLGGTFGVFEVLGHAELLAKHADAIRAVDAERLREVARTHLDPKRRFILTFKSSGKASKPLPDDPRMLQTAAEEAESAGDLDRAIQAYTRLLAAKPNKMYKVIFYAQRGQLYVKQKDYDGAIRDYEAALRVVDYPAVKKLLQEARKLKEGKKRP